MASPDRDNDKRPPRKTRVDMRKNRARPARGKADISRHFRSGDVRADDAHQVENIRSKGDLSRKRTIVDKQLDHLLTGRVITMRGLVAEVDDGSRTWACTVRRILRTRQIDERHPVGVGDEVRFTPVDHGDEEGRFTSDSQSLPEGVIEEVAPRRTTLLRQYERRVHIVAANVDIALIVMAADQPTLRPHLIDRCIVSVHRGDMCPIICINKADLDAGGLAAEVIDRYRAIGYRAFLTSASRNLGLEEVRSALQDKTSVLIGPSGVGKSSLLNAIDPALSLKIGTLTDLQRGRHTTTTARLLKWSFGGYVVDTPGVRQFELPEVPPTELEAYFKEFVELIQLCKFPDCTHTIESSCAVLAAVEAGTIHPQRHESYCRMLEECRERAREYD